MMTDASGARRRRTLWWCVAILLCVTLPVREEVCAAAVRAGNKPPTPLVCADVGVPVKFRRTAAMPIEELSELTTGKSCVRSAVMASIAGVAGSQLSDAMVTAMDCVATRVDEDQIGVFAVFNFCAKPNAVHSKAAMDAWDAQIRPEIERLFATGGRRDGVLYRNALAEFGNVLMSKSYVLPKTDDAPRFRFKSAQLWTEPDADNADASTIYVKLKAKNEGSAPLHVFAATLKGIDESAGNGAILLTGNQVSPIAPSKDNSIMFEIRLPHRIDLPENREYALYFVHSATRSHLLEGRLEGTKLKLNERKKPKLNHIKDSIRSRQDESASLEGSYAFPYNGWRLMSIGIVMIVGALTTVFMRRKWARTTWSKSLDCWKQKSLRQKNFAGSRTTEMVSRKGVSDDSREPQVIDGEDLEAERLLESDVHKSPPSASNSAPKAAKMPAITMQWRKPVLSREKLLNRMVLSLDDTAQLNPKRFESMWEECIQRHIATFHAKQRPPSIVFVSSMESVGISCMASGSVNGVEKYVMYSKQSDTSDYFFLSVDIVVGTGTVSVTIRASVDTHDALVQQFVALVDKQMLALLK